MGLSGLLLLVVLGFQDAGIVALSADDTSLIQSLEVSGPDEYSGALDRLFARFQQRADAHEFDDAIKLVSAIQRDADTRGVDYALTRIWAATTLGLTFTRAGRHSEADKIVSDEIERVRGEIARATREVEALAKAEENARADELSAWRRRLAQSLTGLYDRRALGRIGAGKQDLALADLGAALARGSRDAALVLGRLALTDGEMDRARTLLGRLLTEGQGEAWARRGWGLTMLP